MKIRQAFTVFLQILTATTLCGGETTDIAVGNPTGKTVSQHLIGMNVVYSHEKADMWSDGSKLESLKAAGINCLRYPGGHVVSFWDWEFPYHDTYANFWDPAYVKSLTPEKKTELKKKNGNRMGLKKYFEICSAGGFEPIVGINMLQGYKYERLNDSLAKAVRLVEYCQKQNPGVTYYYLDNEAGHQPKKNNHIPVKDYVKLIPIYSKAIKAVQPGAKLIVNPINWQGMTELVETAGNDFDILDHHWYYNHRKWELFHLEDWRKETKEVRLGNGLSRFERLKTSSGNKHLRLALLEWNLGPAMGGGGSDKGSAFLQGIVQANMLMNFIEHDVFMAAIWPLTWAPKRTTDGGFRNFIDADTGRVSPSAHIFQWFSIARGGTVLTCTASPASGILTTAVQEKDGNAVFVYVLNKSSERKTVSLSFKHPLDAVSAQSFQEDRSPGEALVRKVPTTSGDGSVSVTLPHTSLLFLKLKPANPTKKTPSKKSDVSK